MTGYADLQQAIKSLGFLDADDPCAVDKKTADAASILAALLEKENFPVPQIFSHGGDCISFVWQMRAGRLYLTEDEGQLYASLVPNKGSTA